ncbi:MAG: hypothetical protein OXD30_11515 [Bryobacterales bacterium]|nr:hypothetical protein [Bryobacterales bacterium]
MPLRPTIAVLFITLLAWASMAQRDRAEVLQISRENAGQMPAGKEADGLPGDFVLRNGKIHALVSGAQPFRRANMATEYDSVLQGCLYDLDLRDAGNDQLTALRPGGEAGYLSHVAIIEDGAAVLEAVRTAALGKGLYSRHEYRLEPGWQFLLVTSSYRNDSQQPVALAPAPIWKGLANEQAVHGIMLGDSIDPFDKRAYAVASADAANMPQETSLEPGEERTFRIRVAVGDSPWRRMACWLRSEGRRAESKGPSRTPPGSPPSTARSPSRWTASGCRNTRTRRAASRSACQPATTTSSSGTLAASWPRKRSRCKAAGRPAFTCRCRPHRP